MAPESGLFPSRLMARLDLLAQRPPGVAVGWAQLRGTERLESSGDCGDDTDRAAHYHGWGSPLTSGGPPLQMAGGAAVLLQVMVGAR